MSYRLSLLSGGPSIQIEPQQSGVTSEEYTMTNNTPTAITSQNERTLVVLNSASPEAILDCVVDTRSIPDSAVDLILVYPTAEYESRRRARIDAGVTTPYTIEHLEEDARRTADRMGREWIDSETVSVGAYGGVGRVADRVNEVVRDRGHSVVCADNTMPTRWQQLFGAIDISRKLAEKLPCDTEIRPISTLQPKEGHSFLPVIESEPVPRVGTIPPTEK